VSTLRVACVQMRSGTEVAPNIAAATDLVRQAASAGATLIATPEMTNLLDIRPGIARPKIVTQEKDATLAAFRALAEELGVWLLLGSIAVALDDDERFANRSFLISPRGSIVAQYDKMHMFDVEVGDGQTYRESRTYRPGEVAVLARTDFGAVGMTICYDLRFPALYRSLAQAGAQILTIPAAFTRVTGEAHWHVLLRARAIETGCFVIAPAQSGRHEDGRETFGHCLIISPWGEILAEAEGNAPGVVWADIDLDDVEKARARIPSLGNDRALPISDGTSKT
jgi:deaminated glutathione amidase